MIEKFDDYEGGNFIATEGVFDFEVKDYELKESKNGNPMAVFNVQSKEGRSTVYCSLNPKARWNYNRLIRACFYPNDPPKELDYELIGNDLVGEHFFGKVVLETYEKPVKRLLEDGTYENDVEISDTYKIKEFLCTDE